MNSMDDKEHTSRLAATEMKTKHTDYVSEECQENVETTKDSSRMGCYRSYGRVHRVTTG